MVNINITQEAWLIFSVLCTAIVFLVTYIVKQHNISRKEQKEFREIQDKNLVNMVTAMLNSNKAIEGIDKTIEGTTDVMKEVKDLMHTVNTRIIEMNAKNGNKNY